MSSTATWGRSAGDAGQRGRSRGRFAYHLDVRLASSRVRTPLRTPSWSSSRNTRIWLTASSPLFISPVKVTTCPFLGPRIANGARCSNLHARYSAWPLAKVLGPGEERHSARRVVRYPAGWLMVLAVGAGSARLSTSHLGTLVPTHPRVPRGFTDGPAPGAMIKLRPREISDESSGRSACLSFQRSPRSRRAHARAVRT